MGLRYSNNKNLKDLYISSGNFSNTYTSINYRYLIGLNKFAQKIDPFMHYNGNSIKKKNKLRYKRYKKSKDEIVILSKTWELYLISKNLIDLSNIQNKKNVLETIELFFKKRKEIIILLYNL